MTTYDPSTFSNINDIKTTHLDIQWDVDFEKKRILGKAVIHLDVLNEKASNIILDTNNLVIHQVLCYSRSLEYKLFEKSASFGTALKIDLKQVKLAKTIELTINYETTPSSAALQWLNKEQTLGKSHPFLFTQCQAIYARSLVPCQDSPSIKFTYTAKVTVDKGLIALMSAIPKNPPKAVEGIANKTCFEFEQKTPMPSYLLAIAVGNLASRKLSNRSSVWSEPEIIEKCEFEFSETEKFIKTGEELLTEYEWILYDLLVLPPSFPYGGMENPCLTFVTPTLLAGDKSAADVVAHEISHSWTGNLVTTQNWEHFWLNEGWTMFVERKITGRIHGEKMRQFSSIIGLNSLKQEIEFMGAENKLTALVPNLENVDPDDAFSSVPYEKGYNLLYYLEQLLGGPKIFEPYMKAYIREFRNSSITTKHWKDFLFQYFEKHNPEKLPLLNDVDWKSWFNKPGMPIIKNNFDNSLCLECESIFEEWKELSEDSSLDLFNNNKFNDLIVLQKVYLMDMLINSTAKFSRKKIDLLDKNHDLTKIKNNEIKFRWQMFCLKNDYLPIYDEVTKFLVEQGRMKYVRPLYRALSKAKDGSKIAKDLFTKNKDFYHHIAASQIEKDLFGKQ